jgi:uncharacterized membrane protein YbaN (DUF454 family)
MSTGIKDKLKKTGFTILGTTFLAVGTIGIVLPILPTTPFLLLAAACYLKGSTRMHNWLLNNKVFGAYIRNYREGRGMTMRAKMFTLTLLWVTIACSAFVVSMLIVQVILLVVCIGVTAHLLKIPTYRPTTAANQTSVEKLNYEKKKKEAF